MITVAEHTLEETLLPEKANILDLGCRGFLFADELKRLGHNVFCVDVEDFHDHGHNFYRCAITGKNGYYRIVISNDPNATTVKECGYQENDILGFTLPHFLKSLPKMDLIKFDIEGSEYEVIMSLTEPPAKQLSIEFHLHTGIYGLEQVAEMRDKLESLGYTTVKHDMTKQHGMGLNFWDSLFIL